MKPSTRNLLGYATTLWCGSVTVFFVSYTLMAYGVNDILALVISYVAAGCVLAGLNCRTPK